MTTTLASFGPWDWTVLAGYFLLLAVTGVLLSRRKQTGTDDYFLAGRSMPVWAVSISVLATAQSAATFIGGPQEAYAGDLTYLSANIGQIIAALIVALVFIPRFYRHHVATVYELLEQRYGRTGKLAASWSFMIGRVFASGARIYIAALAASLILFGDILPMQMTWAIMAIAVVGVGYTLVGGIRSVIWTDVIQTVVYVGASLAALVLLWHRIPLSFGEIVDVLQQPEPDAASKLTVISFKFGGLGPEHTYTFWTALFGFMLLNLGAYGTDQDLAQRMLTCRTAARGSWSLISAILIGIPVTALFMVVGLLLYIFYTQPELMGAAAPESVPYDSRKIFLSFIIDYMPTGMSGLMIAGLFAAGLSSFNSAVNAMSSTFVNDFYRPIDAGRSERFYLQLGRIGVVGWGVLLAAFAVFCVYWQQWQQQQGGETLIKFALRVMVFAYSGLIAVFVAALFTKRGSPVSVVAALITGFVAVAAMNLRVWSKWAPDFSIAFPWQMVFATALAFAVCMIGKRREA